MTTVRSTSTRPPLEQLDFIGYGLGSPYGTAEEKREPRRILHHTYLAGTPNARVE